MEVLHLIVHPFMYFIEYSIVLIMMWQFGMPVSPVLSQSHS